MKKQSRVRGGGKQVSNDCELKPSSYQPTKDELEADLTLPASFDEVVDALFESDRKLPLKNVPDRSV